MKNIYYLLWADVIANDKGYKKNEPGWKSSVYSIITIANAMNLFVILLWLDYLQIDIREHLYIVEPSRSVLSSAFGGFICFGLPFAIINYFAIFYKNRYLKLLQKYQSNFKGKLALAYVFGSILLVVVTVIITP